MRSRTVSIIAVVLSVAGVAVWRSDVLRARLGVPPNSEKQAVEVRRAAEAQYAQLKYFDRSKIHSPQDINDSTGVFIGEDLDRLARGTTGPYTPARLNQVREQAIGILYYRFCQPEFEAYHRFMTGLGYRLCDVETLREKWFAQDYYAFLVGVPCPANITNIEMIGAIWDAESRKNGKPRSLGAIGAGGTAVEAASRRACPGEVQRWAPPGGPLGDAGWIGADFGAFSFYYEPAGRNWTDLRKSGECFESVTIGVILEVENGHRYPFQFYFWYDADLDRWWLGQVAIGNMSPGAMRVFF